MVAIKRQTLESIELRLEELYDAGQQGSSEWIALEAEANKLADAETSRQQAIKLAFAKEQERVAHLRQQLLAGNLDVIDTIGVAEFGDDYEISVEGDNHVVYSRVANDNQQSRHVASSKEEARAKYRKLIWDRLYTKYVRSGEVDHLSQL